MADQITTDVLVIGGGSAGCAAAGRLSEDPSLEVCLLEAGPADSSPLIKVPLGVVALMGHRDFDWRWRSAPLRHLGGREVSVPRGRTLGGSGSINSMVYIRGRASDYDEWLADGCAGWGWDDVLARFRRAENNGRFREDPLHGTSGPLYVNDLPSPHPMVQQWQAAGAAHGIPSNDDFNGEVQEGLGNYQTTMRHGRRWSPADAYLRGAMRRHNLEVITDTLAERIEFSDRTAKTVIARRRGREIRINVRRELVLCAGAIATPTLLMRSGIGPGEHLREFGIHVVIDRPQVGENLHDHPAIGMHYGGGDQGYALSLPTLPANALAPLRYCLARRGLFASNTVEAGGFARTDAALAEPDVQFHFIPARLGHEGKAIVWGRGYYSDVCVLKPKSRGRVRLAAADPAAMPAIDLNLLSDPHDDRTMLAGAKLLRSLLRHPALARGDAEELVPGPDVRSDDELRDMIHRRLGTAYHPVGTCRMGRSDDPRSVVDPTLKLLGTTNVRVADASIMPSVIAGNTNAVSMVIGEAAAEFVAADNRSNSMAITA
ncbi:MAG: GMC family oxidoreductase N-terminal domain-containing protein [Pseudomonadota bacterium]